MKERLICILLVALCMVAFAGCSAVTDTKNEISHESSAQSGVHGAQDTAIPDTDKVILRNAEIYDDYAVFPLCDIIDGLGLPLTWEGVDRATFICNEIKYEISVSEKTLVRIGNDFNLLMCAPGNNHFVCDNKDGVLMVDDNTVYCLFRSFLVYPVRISIDRDEQVVTITPP